MSLSLSTLFGILSRGVSFYYSLWPTRTRCVHVTALDGRELEVEVLVRKGRRSLPALVILPGLDEQAASWRKVLSYLSRAGRRVIVISQRGQGATRDEEIRRYSKPPRSIPREDQLRIVRAVLERFQVGEAFIIGHSYGGGTALGLISDQERGFEITGAALFASHVSHFERFNQNPFLQPSIQAAAWFERLNPFAFKASTAAYLPIFFRQAHRSGALSRDTRKWTDEKIQFLAAMTQGLLKVDTFADVRALESKPLPVHLMIANRDELIPNEAHRRLFESLPRQAKGRFVIQPRARHRLHLDAPKDVAAFILETAGV